MYSFIHSCIHLSIHVYIHSFHFYSFKYSFHFIHFISIHFYSFHLNIYLDTKEEGGVETNTIAEELFKEYLLQKGKPNNYRKRPYSEELIKFSLTMQGYSRKSYKYLRKSLEYSLPCDQTLYKYVKS